MEKRTKDKRKKLQDQHKMSVAKLQKEIEDTSRANNRQLYVHVVYLVLFIFSYFAFPDVRDKSHDQWHKATCSISLFIFCLSRLNGFAVPDLVCGDRAEYRKTQLKRLAGLIKKRAEIEAKIANDMQELNDIYETVRKEMREMLREKVATFG